MDEAAQFIIEFVNQNGIVGVLIITSIALAYWTKRLYDDQREDAKRMRDEVEKLIAPALDRFMNILDRNDRINNNMMQQLNDQRKILEDQKRLIETQSRLYEDLSNDVKQVSRLLPYNPKKPNRK